MCECVSNDCVFKTQSLGQSMTTGKKTVSMKTVFLCLEDTIVSYCVLEDTCVLKTQSSQSMKTGFNHNVSVCQTIVSARHRKCFLTSSHRLPKVCVYMRVCVCVCVRERVSVLMSLF